MCSRALFANGARLKRPEDVLKFTLLHEFDYSDWERWFLANGMDPADARHGTVVDNYEVLFRATIEGQGMSLLMTSIFTQQIATSDLVAPLDQEPRCEFVYYVLYPRGALARPVVREFRQWLLDEAHRT
jgi:DNA-binding transcriptional LysR family regulator